MSDSRKPRTGKTDFVKKAGMLAEMYLARATLKAVVQHDWVNDDTGTRWVVVQFNGRPWLACEEDV